MGIRVTHSDRGSEERLDVGVNLLVMGEHLVTGIIQHPESASNHQRAIMLYHEEYDRIE